LACTVPLESSFWSVAVTVQPGLRAVKSATSCFITSPPMP
jgi:hypothetical protein